MLRSLVTPTDPITMSYNNIMQKLLEHFDPKPLTIVERFHFHKREQSTSETLAEFMAEIRRLAAKCEFGTHLDQVLRDRFVCSMRNEGVQRRLLSESDLDLNKAIRIAFTMESAQTNIQALKTVHQVDRPQGGTVERPVPGASYACNHCGGTGHSPSECRFREAVCHRCYKRGHLRRVCQSARATQGRFHTKDCVTTHTIPRATVRKRRLPSVTQAPSAKKVRPSTSKTTNEDEECLITHTETHDSPFKFNSVDSVWQQNACQQLCLQYHAPTRVRPGGPSHDLT